MRVVIITQYFPPDPPSWIPGGLARELVDRGHEVRVLTTFPHYATGRVAAGFKQRLHHIEHTGGMTIRRVPLFASHSNNAVARVLNYLSVALSMRFARRFVKDADVAYVYATPMTVADPARAWSRSMRVPFVLHVQDMWPESVTGSGLLPSLLERAVRFPLDFWLKRVYRAAATTIAIAPTMQSMLIDRGVPLARAVTVFNWSDDADSTIPRTSAPNWNGLRLMYAGNLGRMQDLSTIIRALAEVKELPDVTLRIAGSGVVEPDLRALCASLRLTNVEFLGRLPRNKIHSLYETSDFQLVPLKDLDIFEGTIPSKFQAGIANGIPAITTVRGDLRILVENHGLGLTADPENVRSLAEAIRHAYSMSAEERNKHRLRARSYYEAVMSRSAAIDAIEKVLHDASLKTSIERKRI